MGDNRLPGKSLDSRDSRVGFVKIENIVGKVFIRLYPFSKITLLK
ncbi:S26 family signal peptidase [Tepidibacter formicigenes]|jgi:signal peptidase I